MIDDKIALIKSTRDYTEVIFGAKDGEDLVIYVANNNTIVKIVNSPCYRCNDTWVVTCNPQDIADAVKEIIDGNTGAFDILFENAHAYATSCKFEEFSQVEAYMALDTVVPYISTISTDNFDYAIIFHDYQMACRNRALKELNVSNPGLFENVFDKLAFANKNTFTSVRNVYELVRACYTYNTYCCRLFDWLNYVGKCIPLDTEIATDLNEIGVKYLRDNCLNKEFQMYELVDLLITWVGFKGTTLRELLYRLNQCGITIEDSK